MQQRRSWWILAYSCTSTGLGLHSDVATLKTAGATRNLQFLMGIAAAYGVLYLRLRVGLWLAALGVLGFFATGIMENAGA